MKRIIFTLFLSLFMSLSLWAQQTPQAFKYQAVARDQGGAVLVQQALALQMAILQGSDTGTVIYREQHQVNTNDFGLFHLEVGRGTLLSGDFGTIDWGSTAHYVQVALDASNSGTFQLMGTAELLSVPYALHSGTTNTTDDADADPANELQVLSRSGDTLLLSNGGGSVILEQNDQDWAIDGLDLYRQAGSVGIGISQPTEKLHIAGNLIVGGAGITNGAAIYMRHDDTVNANNDYIIYNDSANLGGPGIFSFHADQGRANNWRQANASIAAAGASFSQDVTIGHNTPSSYHLSIGNQSYGIYASPTGAFNVYQGAGSNNELRLMSLGNVRVNIDANNNMSDKAFIVAKDADDGSSAELFRIQENGYVGIGNTAPRERLEVSGAFLSTAPYGSFESTTLHSLGFDADATVGGSDTKAARIVSSHSQSALAFYTANVERFRVSADGHVGIGTMSPGAKLTLSESVDNWTWFDHYNTHTGSQAGVVYRLLTQAADHSGIVSLDLWKHRSGGGGINNYDSNGYLSFNVGGQQGIYINNQNRVGVGTVNPQARLDISGNVAVNGTEVINSAGQWVGPVAPGAGIPTGAIVMWSGAPGAIPAGWALCDGANGRPDLRGRFVVGYHPADADYNSIGATGGAEAVTLTIAQMPSHSHGNRVFSGYGGSGSAVNTYPSGSTYAGGAYRGLRGNNSDTVNTNEIVAEGGGQAHENRPPYYTLAFIIKL